MEKTSISDLPYNKVNFYIVAHADDWQLFMHPNVYHDFVEPTTKVVFIITTAGDAGSDETFWSAREEGCKSSIRFCLAPLTALLESSEIREINNHTISYWSANHVACYFLRLPDGNLDGKGFSSNNYQSLSRLKNNEITAITAVDNSTIYTSWTDLCDTLQNIVQLESNKIEDLLLNYINPGTSENPNDHKDHIATGQAIQEMEVAEGLPQALYVGYSTRDSEQKLPLADLFWKAGMFAAYEKAVFDLSGYSTLKESVETYSQWCINSSKYITKNI